MRGGAPALLALAAARGGRAWATVGARPADFTLRAAQGAPWKGTFRLSEHLGKSPVLIHFMATWCNPCELEMTTLERLRPTFAPRGLVMVGISIDDAQTAPGVGPMARRLKVTYPIVVDTDSTVSARLNPRRFCPYTIMVDRRGVIAREHEGWTPAHARALPGELETLVAR